MSENTDRNGSRQGAPTLDWTFVPSHIAEGPPEVRHVDGWLVCETCSDNYARLMAAAPDLLACVEMALESSGYEHERKIFRAAIAKATAHHPTSQERELSA